MKASAILLLMLSGPVLAGCAAVQPSARQPASPAPDSTQAISSTPTVAPAAPATAAGEWPAYDNARAGFSAKVPPDWTVKEGSGANGELLTIFTAPGNAASITVGVASDGSAAQQPQDMPNTRCQPVTISGAAARRCFDTIAGSYSTTVSGKSRLYTIATSGHFLDQAIYQRFLDDFALTP